MVIGDYAQRPEIKKCDIEKVVESFKPNCETLKKIGFSA